MARYVQVGVIGAQPLSVDEKLSYKVKVEDPGFLGSVLVTSETDEFTVQDLIKEFGLELLDDYMQRSKDYRDKSVIL